MIYYKTGIALPEVPVNCVPLQDSTDYALETALAYNASGMALYWHFDDLDGNHTVTQVTPAASGNYLWAHQAQGMYTIQIPASGGASINNNQEGTGYFTGFITGVLPFAGPKIVFRSAFALEPNITGSVDDSSATTTSFVTDLAATETDHYKDMWLVFTSGDLEGQAKKVRAFNATTNAITTDPFSSAPGDNDTFVLIGK